MLLIIATWNNVGLGTMAPKPQPTPRGRGRPPLAPTGRQAGQTRRSPVEPEFAASVESESGAAQLQCFRSTQGREQSAQPTQPHQQSS